MLCFSLWAVLFTLHCQHWESNSQFSGDLLLGEMFLTDMNLNPYLLIKHACSRHVCVCLVESSQSSETVTSEGLHRTAFHCV